MDGHVAIEEWKDPNPVSEVLMPGVLTGAFPPDTTGGHGNEGAKAGFEKHGFSVATSSPQEGGRSLPMTSQSIQKSGCSSSLAERMQARAGFRVPELSMPFSTATGADNAVSGAPSPYLTIPPGLSPATLLESPVFLSNAMGQSSPTTGKLFILGGTNDTNPNRFEGPPQGDGTGAFSFKPLDLKSSHYITEAKKECSRNNQHPSAPSTQASVKTETKVQTVQEANLPGHLNQQQLNDGQRNCNKRSRLAPDTAASTEHVSPPDHGRPADEADARTDFTAVAAAAAPAEDGYSWRKYGQKQVKHSEYPRSYYKCTHPSCQVKKKVERSHEGHVTEIIYKGTHCHPKPAQGRRPGAAVHAFGSDAQADSNPAGSQGNHPWHGNAVGVAGDGVDAASSPSVPGELCDSSASMQVHDGARFESPDGVDVSSAMCDEVDGERVTHGSLSQGGADAEGDELESKRRKLELESYAIDRSNVSRAVREPRVVIQTTSEVDILDDGYRWRKYGQKVVKGNPNPRSYYKCTHPGCAVRKHVERASHDLKSVITTYEGKHNHEVPAARNSGHPTSAPMAAARRPEHHHHSSVQDGLMRLGGGCAFPPRDPLVPMANYPYSALGASLPSLPMPAGLRAGGVEGLKLPMLAPSMHHHPLLRHRQAMETAGLVAPEVKREAAGAPGAGAADAAALYQQLMQRRLQLGHQM
ncbi:hypothetical protein QOZ80_4AG0313960 [Eleusine coracana subsp. coracana]|nr:hypothetical protein QOZ80_4AG0313960 [Eleusine coracana subsp. coracana]